MWSHMKQSLMLYPAFVRRKFLDRYSTAPLGHCDQHGRFAGFSTIGDMARHVLFDTLHRNFAVAGHSMGGRVASEITRIEPARITGLALLNTSVHAVRDGEPQGREHSAAPGLRARHVGVGGRVVAALLGSDNARAAQLMPRLTTMIERWSPDAFARQWARCYAGRTHFRFCPASRSPPCC